MSNYPRMLYKGNQREYEYLIAQNESEEHGLKDQGYVGFYDLPEPKTDNLNDKSSEKDPSLDEELKDALEKVEQLQEELADFKGTHIAFLNDVPAMKTRIAELESGDEGQDFNPVKPESHDYTSMTSDQIRKVLDEKGIKWLKRDDKDTLISYLTKE